MLSGERPTDEDALDRLMVGAWCSVCLATALAMLLMIPLTLDETVPWSLLLCAALGLSLLAAPDVLGIAKPAADSLHLAGALVLVVAVVAWAEVARVVRFLNMPLGVWIAVSPFVLGGAGGIATGITVAAGLLTALLSVPRGPVRERYGSYDRCVV